MQVLENERFRVEISEMGAELTSAVDRLMDEMKGESL